MRCLREALALLLVTTMICSTCLECGMQVQTSEKLFAVTTGLTNIVKPICGSCVSAIPADATCPGEACSRDEVGLVIHYASAEVVEGLYDDDTFESGKIHFCLRDGNAQRYLPKCFSSRDLPQPTTDIVARQAKRRRVAA